MVARESPNFDWTCYSPSTLDPANRFYSHGDCYCTADSDIKQVLAACGNQPPQPTKPLPHILLVVVDDLGSNDFGFRGKQILTPHVDQLRAEGVLIESFCE